MSNQNIFQVTSEKHLDEILNDNYDKLSIIMFSSNNKSCKEFIPTFYSISRDNPDCFFVYLDINNFEEDKLHSKYTKNIQHTPKFLYFYNRHNMANVNVPDRDTFIETMMFLKDKINSYKSELKVVNKVHNPEAVVYTKEAPVNKPYQQIIPDHLQPASKMISPLQQEMLQTSPIAPIEVPTSRAGGDDIQEKVNLLKVLYELKQQGAVLSQNFGLESDLNMMRYEYARIINNIPLDTLSQSSSRSDHRTMPMETDEERELKKQEKIKKIKELSKITNMLQCQQINKLQKLLYIQKKKEEEEERKQNSSG